MATRGPERLCSVTYPQMAEWTGYTVKTLRTYAARGYFTRNSVLSVISWANQIRQKKGWQLLGQPDDELNRPVNKDGEKSQENSLDKSPNQPDILEISPASEPISSADDEIVISRPDDPFKGVGGPHYNYNPETGEMIDG